MHPSPEEKREREREICTSSPLWIIPLYSSLKKAMHTLQEKALSMSKNMHLSAHFHDAFMVKVLCETALQMDSSANMHTVHI